MTTAKSQETPQQVWGLSITSFINTHYHYSNALAMSAAELESIY